MALPKTELPKTDDIGYLQRWFASNYLRIKEFDLSAIGFHNWLKKYYPHLIEK